jgi:GNAT superfamily N-acetyltransferase
MDVRIRSYRPGDRATVVDLVTKVLVEYGFSSMQVGSLERDLEEIERAESNVDQQRSAFWVAESEGEVVGTIAVRPKDGSTCEIKRLYLRSDKRGLGLGQKLYEHAESFALTAGYERIWLDSSRRFGKAHRLYERNGFVLVEELDNEWEDSVYEKTLGTR